jgi:hypothetical protein
MAELQKLHHRVVVLSSVHASVAHQRRRSHMSFTASSVFHTRTLLSPGTNRRISSSASTTWTNVTRRCGHTHYRSARQCT